MGDRPRRDVRALRAALDLDAAYVSRLLRGLEADGLVVVDPSPTDGRVRTARLTPEGAPSVACSTVAPTSWPPRSWNR